MSKLSTCTFSVYEHIYTQYRIKKWYDESLSTLLKIFVKITNFCFSYQFKLVIRTYILLVKWNWLLQPFVIGLVQHIIYWLAIYNHLINGYKFDSTSVTIYDQLIIG